MRRMECTNRRRSDRAAPAGWAGVALASALGLAGCAGTPRGGDVDVRPEVVAPPPSAPRPAPAVSLEREQRALAQALRGTPVVVVLDDDGALWIEVPAAQGFEPGQAALRPTLASVLDHVAASLQRVPTARAQVRAPSDAGAGIVLADRRAVQVRVHLVRRGIAPTRITGVAASQPEWLRVKLELPALRPPPGRAAP